MKQSTSLIPVRLGGLLISSGFVRPDLMAGALAQARQHQQKLGEILVSTNLLTEADLNCALEIQRLIKTGSITVEMGTQALKQTRTSKSNDGVHSALAQLGYNEDQAIKTVDLASILQEAGVVSKEQVEQASWNAAKNGLPLGRNLVLAGAISPSGLGSALNALVLLREGTVNRQQTVAALRTCHQQKTPLEAILVQAANISPNHVRVGELLSSAGLLSESDAMIAVENGLLNQKTIGQVLLEVRMVSGLVLDACIKLQTMVKSGAVSKLQASELLRQVATKQVGLEDFLSEMSHLKSRVLELFVRSGLVTEYHLQTVLVQSPELEGDLIKALFVHDVITHEMFRNGVRCIYTIDAGTYTVDKMAEWLRNEYTDMLQASA